MKTPKTPHKQADIEQKLKEIGSMVRAYRKKINNNYQDFANENQINKVTLARIENGENFTMSSFIQVLNTMGITLEEFFGDATK